MLDVWRNPNAVAWRQELQPARDWADRFRCLIFRANSVLRRGMRSRASSRLLKSFGGGARILPISPSYTIVLPEDFGKGVSDLGHKRRGLMHGRTLRLLHKWRLGSKLRLMSKEWRHVGTSGCRHDFTFLASCRHLEEVLRRGILARWRISCLACSAAGRTAASVVESVFVS